MFDKVVFSVASWAGQCYVHEADVDEAESIVVAYVVMHKTQGPELIKFGDVYVAMEVAKDER
jgi:hypothetical protein